MMLKYLFKRYLKKRVVLLLFVCTISTMCWFLLVVIITKDRDPAKDDLPKEEEKVGHADKPEVDTNLESPKVNDLHNNVTAHIPDRIVDIWSTVGLGDYMWEHLLGGNRVEMSKVPAELIYGSILLRYHGGSVSVEDLPVESANVLLVLNGRAEERLHYTRTWLDKLSSLPRLQTAQLMLIGDEACDNGWLLPYIAGNGGVLDKVFISYDATIVDDDRVFQWPLGSATYRGFPLEDSRFLLSDASRQYRCNFLGTVYPNSSREKLVEVLEKYHLEDYCYVKIRQEWDTEERTESMDKYVQVLQQSDLTLSPVGKNIECYRIYEAAAMGSVPVIEDVRTSEKCSERTLRLLKRRKAPFIFIKDWSELPDVIREELRLSPEMIIERRKNLIKWYQGFKDEMRKVLLTEIEIRLN